MLANLHEWPEGHSVTDWKEMFGEPPVFVAKQHLVLAFSEQDKSRFASPGKGSLQCTVNVQGLNPIAVDLQHCQQDDTNPAFRDGYSIDNSTKSPRFPEVVLPPELILGLLPAAHLPNALHQHPQTASFYPPKHLVCMPSNKTHLQNHWQLDSTFKLLGFMK